MAAGMVLLPLLHTNTNRPYVRTKKPGLAASDQAPSKLGSATLSALLRLILLLINLLHAVLRGVRLLCGILRIFLLRLSGLTRGLGLICFDFVRHDVLLIGIPRSRGEFAECRTTVSVPKGPRRLLGTPILLFRASPAWRADDGINVSGRLRAAMDAQRSAGGLSHTRGCRSWVGNFDINRREA
jgi:hypothetical protein